MSKLERGLEVSSDTGRTRESKAAELKETVNLQKVAQVMALPLNVPREELRQLN